jgi:hypothetical protein
MKVGLLLLFLSIFSLSQNLFAQSDLIQTDVPPTDLSSEPPTDFADDPPIDLNPINSDTAKSSRSLVDQENDLQNKILNEKKDYSEEVSPDPDANRYPDHKPYFEKPKGPPQGGKVYLPHPSAKKGLLGISKQNVYQYETFKKDKSQSGWFRFGMMSPPVITGANSDITFKTIYSSGNFPIFLGGYEWQAFRSFGKLGLQVESGLATLSGKGRFETPVGTSQITVAKESIQMFIVPLTAFVSYKLEYTSKQAIVPYVNGGFTYYGMIEKREDKDSYTIAGAPATGGGGGLNFSLTRLDPDSAYILASDYGFADVWITLEGRFMKGLDQSKDFTSTLFSFGFAADY